MRMILYKTGRFLQAAGLFVILPMAMAGQVLERLNEKQMLVLCGIGMGVFLVGWLLQQAGGPAQ
jgi:hypothetical protein